MTFSVKTLCAGQVSFDSHGTPFNVQYDDVYHARQGALAQAHHVFLQGNQLPGRWRGKSVFTVCETGFGLGQNFLALWEAWRNDSARARRLHVVSFEAHPLTQADLSQVLHAQLPAHLLPLGLQLIDAWPPLLTGLHRLEFEGGALTLTLAFGAVKYLAKQVQTSVDAYFLDGFAPKKNPEMWTPALFGQLVRMANADATVATWCTAGHVRRALRDAGFLVRRVNGLGGKAQMTVAVLRPGLGRLRVVLPADGLRTVLVVGGGLAGAGVAHSLALRGDRVVVADPVFRQGLGASHKGHFAAALTPLISKDDDYRARLTRAGSLRALHRWQALPSQVRPWRCGTLELVGSAEEEAERREVLASLSFPTEWVSWLDREEASQRIGFPVKQGGVFFADGQLIRPEALITALLQHPQISCRATDIAQLSRNSDGRWQAKDETGATVLCADAVVIANAMQAPSLLATTPYSSAFPKLFAMEQLAGQVSYFSGSAREWDPKLIVGGIGYWLPAVNHVSVGGSTYVDNTGQAQVTKSGHLAVACKIAKLLNVSSARVVSWLDTAGGWAGWRAVVSGRLPVIGPVAPGSGLWLACAYGSRGLTWSALAGDIIAAQLHQEPLVIERDLLRAIAPR